MDTKSNLLTFIKYKNISKSDFYKKTGLSNGFLDKGNSVSSLNLEIILKNYPELNPEWLIIGEGQMLRKEHKLEPFDTGIPLITIDAVAGIPQGDINSCMLQDCQQYIVPEFNNLHVDYLIRVSGSSMYPKYSNGDILACRRIEDVQFFQWGKIYVIDSSQGALVKRVYEDSDPSKITLVSDNRDNYPPFSIPISDIRSLSIVVGVIRIE